MPKEFSVKAVSCFRGKTFDAEVHFQQVEWKLDDSEIVTIAKVIRTGLSTREQAKVIAEVVVNNIEVALIDAAKTILDQYKTAKP